MAVVRSVNRALLWEESRGRAESIWQAVSDLEAGGVGGLDQGEGQSGCTGSGWAVAGGVRGGSEEQPVQDLEPDVVGDLLPAPGEGGGNPEGARAGTRMLGVPTVADRVAQTVVAAHLEERVEPMFHPDSYGYRPGRSALDAVGACRERCWEYDWVIDLDIRKFFDSVPWDLVVKAVEAHTDARWVLLYVKRWLAAPLQMPDGTLQQRDRGTPQGSAVSPVLANLFMHVRHEC